MKKRVLKNVLTANAAIMSLLILFFISGNYFCTSGEAADENTYESVLRLHIIANSDSAEDQAVKLKVRDALLAYEKEAMNAVCDKAQAKEILMSHGSQILSLTENVLKENGFDYSAQLMLGEFVFPTREYGDKTYPAGTYEALRIVLGDGAGKNWWCVMFPPLCILEVNDGKIEQEKLSFDSLLLDLIKSIDGGLIWNSIKESWPFCLQ